MYFLAFWCSTDLIQSYVSAFVSPVCVVLACVRKRREERERRGWVAVNC